MKYVVRTVLYELFEVEAKNEEEARRIIERDLDTLDAISGGFDIEDITPLEETAGYSEEEFNELCKIILSPGVEIMTKVKEQPTS